jgi:dUTP pyrophosphatase
MSSALTIAIQRLPGLADLSLPEYKSRHAAAMDLAAALREPIVLEPGGRALVPCGFSIAVPDGYEAQVRPRSGLATRHGVTVVNAPGTIDADYRGEVMVALVNLGAEPFVVARGMRIAQLLVAPVPRVVWSEVDALPPTVRGAGGFGHTGA